MRKRTLDTVSRQGAQRRLDEFKKSRNKKLDAETKISAARSMASDQFDYFSSLFERMVFMEPDPKYGLRTMSVTHQLVVGFYRPFIDECSVLELKWVLIHEALHPMHDHPSRWVEMFGYDPLELEEALERISKEVVDVMLKSRMWNISADYGINQLLEILAKQNNESLPGEYVSPSSLDIEPGLTSEAVYNILMKREQEQEQEPDENEEGDGESSNDDGDSEGESPNGKEDTEGNSPDGETPSQESDEGEDSDGNEGKDSDGNEGEDDGDNDTEDGGGNGSRDEGSENGENSNDSDKSPGNGGGGTNAGGVPQEWEKDIPDDVGLNPDEVDMVMRLVAQEVKNHEMEKGIGSVPGFLSLWSKELLEIPPVTWEEQLNSNLKASFEKLLKGGGDQSFDRISRNQFKLGGFGMGIPILSRTIMPDLLVAVMLDTSGSMGLEEIQLAIATVKALVEATDCNLLFGCCDCAASEIVEVDNWYDIPDHIVGGGGTDFRPGFKLLKDYHPQPDIVIYITDGGGIGPTKAPDWCDTFWVIVGDDTCNPIDNRGNKISWGDFVHVSNKK